MNLFLAFLFRDAAIEKNYRFHLAVKTLSIIFQLAVFYFLTRHFMQPEYFSFIFVGLLFSRFFQFLLSVFTENIRQEQYWGTAELLFLSPRPAFLVTVASAGGKFLFLAVEMLVYVAIGKYVFGAVFFAPPLLLLFIFLNGLAFAGLGLMAGSCIMYFKRGDPVNWLVSGSFDLLSGVYFPVAVLPETLAAFSRLLPTTTALGVWREMMLQGLPPSPGQVAIQAAWAAGLALAGLLVFLQALRLTRRSGELGGY